MAARDKYSLPRAPLVAAAVELRRLERNQRRSEDEIRAQQRQRLHRLLGHSRLEELPVVTREEATSREMSDRLSGPVPTGSRVVWSSGTTGHPISVPYPPRGAWWQGVLLLRTTRAQGIQPWHRTAYLTLIPDERARPRMLRFAQRRHTALPASLGAEETARRLLEARPEVIGGRGTLLEEVGEVLDGQLRPRVIGTAGEQLSPETRAALKRFFGVTPLDVYGTTEVGVVAWQCSAGDLYHVNNEAVIVEVLDDHGAPVAPGETGDLVLTGLWNPLMPFIRYRIGDQGALAARPCACGVALPALGPIDGRRMDWLTDARGHRLPPHRLFLTVLVDESVLSWIRRYRVVQDRTRRVQVQIEAREHPPETELDRVRAGYQRVFGAGIPVDVVVVDRLDVDQSGKFRLFVASGNAVMLS